MKDNLLDILPHLKSLAREKNKENRHFLQRVKKRKAGKVDEAIHHLHHEVFEKIDCKECANCCKTLGPRLTNKDIDRIGDYLKIRPQEVINRYVKTDEDQDMVFNRLPCPFLADNLCTIYEVRPKACREYPHTHQPGQIKITKLTMANTHACPAVYHILERLKKQFNSI